MLGISIKLTGEYGHFKRPETNNNPCSYSVMHKPAIVGFMGAVLGIERKDMAPLYPQLCDDLICSIRIVTPVVKEAYGFTKRKVTRAKFFEQGQRYCEFIKKPEYEIVIGCNDRSKDIFEKFCDHIRTGKSLYPTYFGVVSCPCVYQYTGDVDVSPEETGVFETYALISSKKHTIESPTEEVDLIFERVPTHIKDSFYTPERMTSVICLQGDKLKVTGPYRSYDGDKKSWFI